MYCPNCTKKLPIDASECTYCKAWVGEEARSASRQSGAIYMRRGPFFAGLLTGCLATAAVAYWLVPASRTQPGQPTPSAMAEAPAMTGGQPTMPGVPKAAQNSPAPTASK